jgi:hypothetical protein
MVVSIREDFMFYSLRQIDCVAPCSKQRAWLRTGCVSDERLVNARRMPL